MNMALYVISANKSRFDMEDIEGLKMLSTILKDKYHQIYLVLNKLDEIQEMEREKKLKTWKQEIF